MKKIVFFKGKGEDYLADCIFHGLIENNYFVISNVDMSYMFDDYSNKSNLYGKGFNLFASLEQSKKSNYVVMSNHEIATLDSNLIEFYIFASIHRENNLFFPLYNNLNKDKIRVIDGEDEAIFWVDYSKLTIPVFKRELNIKISENIFPISFAVPSKIISTNEINKSKPYGTVIPGNLGTYIFNDEKLYNKDYEDSVFGVTMKKGGWDCFRHHEIIANNCFPYFVEIEKCPSYTLFNFNKPHIFKVNECKFEGMDYSENVNYIKSNLLDTETLVEYILDPYKVSINPNIHQMNVDFIKNKHEFMCRGGEGQSIDIFEHLPTIKKYAEKCTHITEMGVRSVVSTWSFLAGLLDNTNYNRMVSYDIEFHPNLVELIENASCLYPAIRYDFILKDVLKTEIEETDLLFLDTWHVYEQVRDELKLHASKVRKYIMFHDTTSYEFKGEGHGRTGIWPAIQEFLDSHSEWKIKERYTNNNGLTIIERVC